RLRVDDAVAIVLEDRAHGVRGLGPGPPLAGAAALGERREDALFVVVQLLADRRHRLAYRLFFGRPRPRLLPRRSLPCFPPLAGSLARRLSCRPAFSRSRSRRPCLSPLRPYRSPWLSWWRGLCPASAKSTLRRTTLTDWTSTRTLSPSA